MSDNKWFVVHTKPKQENVAVENLERQGFKVYCPNIIRSKRKCQYWQEIVEPLFPRYLFVRLNAGKDNFSPIRSTLGVVGLVKFGNKPAVVPVSAINTIYQQECELNNLAVKHPRWKKGDTVEILDGPFSGLRGVFQKKESVERVLLLLDVLGKYNRFSININNLAAVG